MIKLTLDDGTRFEVVELTPAALTLLRSCVDVGYEGIEHGDGFDDLEAPEEPIEQVGQVLALLRTFTGG